MKALVIVVTLATACLLVWHVEQKAAGKEQKDKAGRGGGPVPVAVATAGKKDVPIELRACGTVLAGATVAVKAQASGILAKVHVREGQDVRKDDLLFTLDARPFEIALKQAEAALARAKAQAANARREAGRQEELQKKGIAAEDARDQAGTAAEALQADLRLAEASVENAKLLLGYCRVASPIDGRTGSLAVHEGNLVKANDQALLVINRVAPILVSFSLPQRELPAVVRAMAAASLPVSALIPGDEAAPEAGTLAFLDNAVDQATGTILLKASFPNAGRRLWPGQFVNVTLALGSRPDAVVVPGRAVQTGQKGPCAWVVRPDGKAEFRDLATAAAPGDEVVVLSGLSAGELVVTEGQMKLANGASVLVKEGGPPKAEGGAGTPEGGKKDREAKPARP